MRPIRWLRENFVVIEHIEGAGKNAIAKRHQVLRR